MIRITFWREGLGIEPSEAFTQKPPIRVETCGVHQDHMPPKIYKEFYYIKNKKHIKAKNVLIKIYSKNR